MSTESTPAPTQCGPRPLFPLDPVQIIRGASEREAWYVSFNGDNGIGPFKSREAAEAYAARWGAP